MKINRGKFFSNNILNHLFSGYSQLQVDSINAIFDEIERQNVTDLNQIAYIFGTAYKEAFDYNGASTGRVQHIVPIKEGGGETYLKKKPYYPHYGRGFSQTTWLANYQKAKQRTGIDYVKSPDLMLIPKNTAEDMVFNMRTGGYTTYKLSDYFNSTTCDFVNARMIVNPKDYKSYNEVALYSKHFRDSLTY